MSNHLDPNQVLPPEIATAAETGELVLFVGAGISRMVGCPGWDQMANKILDQLVPNGIDYNELSQITQIADPKKRLSFAKIIAQKHNIQIDYNAIFNSPPTDGDVYSYLNRFNSAFITTNYEMHLVPDSRATEPETNWRFHRRQDLLNVHLDKNGNVIHLHGCLADPDSMIVTTRDYLVHYSSKQVQDFLTYLFANKTVLFLGYGLDEIEVLESIVRNAGMKAAGEQERIRRFTLQGFFSAEVGLAKMLEEYYLETFGMQLIGFPKDKKNYAQQVDILAAWVRQMKFGSLELVDEVTALEDEIRG
ncbi:MAG: SIR2 family protein [Gammaproteobacteria bacterium]